MRSALAAATAVIVSLSSTATAVILTLSSAAAAAVVFLLMALCRWEEFIDREADLFEGVTRVILHVVAALLLWHAEIICRYQHLNVALKLYNRKQAERYAHCFFRGSNVEISVKQSADAARRRAAAFALAAVAWTAKLCLQADRIDALNLRLRIRAGGKELFVCLVRRKLRRENTYIALAAVEDAFLGERSKPLNGAGRIHRRGVSVEINLEEEGDVDGIVAAVERDRLHVDKTVDDLARTAAYGSCIVDNALRPVGKIDAHIGKTILISARIVHAVGIDAHSLTDAAADDICSAAAGSVVRHSVSSYE